MFIGLHIYNMADQKSPMAAILYQNIVKTVTLLDIPRSISLAQGTHENPCTHQLHSSQPLQDPYPSVEPKSKKAKVKVLQTKPASEPHYQFPEILLRQARREIAENWDGEWCLERKLSPSATVRQGKKRKIDEASPPELPAQGQDSSPDTEKEPRVSTLKTEPDLRSPEELLKSRTLSEPLTLSADVTPGVHACSNIRDIANKLVHNPYPAPMSLQYSQTSYMIPPSASFIFSKISEATAPAFSMAALTMYPEPSATTGPGQFDFILLDPPWENRSVRRSAKYKTTRDAYPMDVVRNILAQHIAPGGLVACWVTNKASVRDAALEAFVTWDLQLVEEWAWLKTTVHGVTVTEIEGVWRKPYEVLLLGRRVDESEGFSANERRRVIVAVPDLHSRKPNLKALIESMLPVHYRALEVFARNLTAGWLAWGDEVLKFNWEGHWFKN